MTIYKKFIKNLSKDIDERYGINDSYANYQNCIVQIAKLINYMREEDKKEKNTEPVFAYKYSEDISNIQRLYGISRKRLADFMRVSESWFKNYRYNRIMDEYKIKTVESAMEALKEFCDNNRHWAGYYRDSWERDMERNIDKAFEQFLKDKGLI